MVLLRVLGVRRGGRLFYNFLVMDLMMGDVVSPVEFGKPPKSEHHSLIQYVRSLGPLKASIQNTAGWLVKKLI